VNDVLHSAQRLNGLRAQQSMRIRYHPDQHNDRVYRTLLICF
jgi:hypothetical protein